MISWKIALCLVFAVLASAAFAYNGDLTISNNTGYTVLWVYVVPQDRDSWGTDLLGDEVLLDGESVTIPISNFPNRYADIRIIDVDEDTYTFRSFDLELRTLTLILDLLDKRR